jgi:FkbM family methyltransferase
MASVAKIVRRATDLAKLYSKLAQLYGPVRALRIQASLFNRWSAHGSRFAVNLPDYAEPIFLRAHSSDVPTFRQTLIDRQYSFSGFAQESLILRRYEDLLARGKTPLIIDCGANIGLSAVWFAKHFPAARIIAVEPSAGNFEMLKANVRGYPLVTPLRGAIWDQETTLEIADLDVEPWEFQVEEKPAEMSEAAAANDSKAVAALTMNGISRMGGEADGIFIAKIDIEGAEQFLFRSNTEWVASCDVLIIELHDWMIPGEGSSNNFFRSLATLPTFDYLARDENIFVVRPVVAPAIVEAAGVAGGAEDAAHLEAVGEGPRGGHRDYRKAPTSR